MIIHLLSFIRSYRIEYLLISSIGTDGRDDLIRKKNSLEEENKKLQEKVQYLSDQLEYRHLKGDFDPRQTKIIHLK